MNYLMKITKKKKREKIFRFLKRSASVYYALLKIIEMIELSHKI